MLRIEFEGNAEEILHDMQLLLGARTLTQKKAPEKAEPETVKVVKTARAADEAQATDKAQTTVETSAPAGEGVLDRLSAWFAETFPHSRYAVLGGLAGLVVALLLFWIGVLKTLVIVVLVVVGVAIGQYLDGDPRLIRIVQGLVKRR